MSKIYRFTASWCAPCKALAKVIESVNSDYEIEVVDIDQNPDLARSFAIRGVPTLVKLDSEGKEQDRLVGLFSSEVLSKWMKKSNV